MLEDLTVDTVRLDTLETIVKFLLTDYCVRVTPQESEYAKTSLLAAGLNKSSLPFPTDVELAEKISQLLSNRMRVLLGPVEDQEIEIRQKHGLPPVRQLV